MSHPRRKRFTVYAATADEANEGWIWIASDVPTRTIIKITNERVHRSAHCAVRNIDENFLDKYKEPRVGRIEIRDPADALVINQWYRDLLGGFETSERSGCGVELAITPSKLPVWGAVRAACQHPDIVARVGVRLGLLAVWLGLVALVPTVYDALHASPSLVSFVRLIFRALDWNEYQNRNIAVIVVAVLGAIVGWLAGRP